MQIEERYSKDRRRLPSDVPVYPGCEDWDFISVGQRIASEWYDDAGPLNDLRRGKSVPAVKVKKELMMLMASGNDAAVKWQVRFETFMVYVDRMIEREKLLSLLKKAKAQAVKAGVEPKAASHLFNTILAVDIR